MHYKLDNTNLNISLFKSGDFREDSGIYFSNGKFKCCWCGLKSNKFKVDFMLLLASGHLATHLCLKIINY